MKSKEMEDEQEGDCIAMRVNDSESALECFVTIRIDLYKNNNIKMAT